MIPIDQIINEMRTYVEDDKYDPDVSTWITALELITRDYQEELEFLRSVKESRGKEITRLEAEIERLNADITRFRDVYNAARGLCHGYDWNKGNHAVLHKYRPRLVLAVHAIEPLPDEYVVNRAIAATEKL
jgi:uncharacterized small protein (DUF1192 family)